MDQSGRFKINFLKYFEINENENTPYQNPCYAAIAVLGGKFIALNAHFRKEKNLKSVTKSSHIRKLKKEKQKPKKLKRGK